MTNFAARRFPIVEKRKRERAAGEAQMPLDRARARWLSSARSRWRSVALPVAASSFSAAVCADSAEQRLERDHRGVAALSERAVGVEDVRDAAAHARREIASGAAEHDDRAARHVLAAVVAGALDHRARAGVAHAEALAGHAAVIRLALDRAVHHRVADDDVLLRLGGTRRVRIHDDASARQALADVVVGRALKLEGDAAGEEGAEALARDALERDVDRVLRQAFVAVPLRHDAGKHGADRAVGVADLVRDANRLLLQDRRLRRLDELVIERARKPVVLLLLARARDVRRHLRLVEHAREVEPARLPVRDARAHVEQVGCVRSSRRTCGSPGAP